MAVANIDVRVNSRPAVAGLNQVNAASKAATTGVNGLKTAIAPLLSAFAAMQAVKFVFAKTSELETQTKSLEVLTGSVEKATKIIAELTQLGAVTPFTSTELIDAAKRLQAFGVEGDKVVETTRRLADVSGATGAELQGLVTAYGQVQAKGRLQGEELLQFQERGIGLQDELRKMYGMTGQEFQKALSKGRIGAEAVEVAIVRLTEKGGKYANGAIAQSGTLSGKFSTLTDGVEAIAKKIGNVLKPALLEILNLGIAVVDTINRALAGPDYKKANDQLFNTRAQIKKLKGEIATGEAAGIGLTKGIQIQGLETGISPQQGLDAMGGFSLPAASPSVPVLPRMRADLAQLNKQATSLQKRLVELRQVTTPTKPNLKTPDLLGETGGTKKGGGGADKAANEAKRIAERLRTLDSESILNQKLLDLKQLQFNAELAEDQQLLIRLKGNEEILKIAQKTRLEIAKATSPKERQLLLDQMVVDLGKTHLNTAQELIRAAKDQSKPLDDIVKASKEKLEDDKAALLLQQQGMSPELAKQFVAIEKAAKLEKEKLPLMIMSAEAAIVQAEANGQDVTALKKDIEALKTRAGMQSAARAQTAKDNATANDQAAKAADAAAQLKAIYEDIGMTIKDGVVGAIKGAVDGTKSLGQVASEVLSRIADKVLDVAINMALFGAMSGTGTGGGLLGSIFGGKRAMGGSVTGGRSYMVGERGPELFSPGRSGGIAPTGSFGGSTNVVINVDASGSNVQGDQAQAKALGNAISAAVQSELVKQKRPGGLLA
jgi:tape measure domain-containing protein